MMSGDGMLSSLERERRIERVWEREREREKRERQERREERERERKEKEREREREHERWRRPARSQSRAKFEGFEDHDSTHMTKPGGWIDGSTERSRGKKYKVNMFRRFIMRNDGRWSTIVTHEGRGGIA